MSESAILVLKERVDPTYSVKLRPARSGSYRIPTEPTSTELALPVPTYNTDDEPTWAAPAARFCADDAATLAGAQLCLRPSERTPRIQPRVRVPAQRKNVGRKHAPTTLIFAAVAGLGVAVAIVSVFSLAAIFAAMPPVVAACLGLGLLFFDLSAVSLVAAVSLR